MGRVRELRSVWGIEELKAARQLGKAVLAEFLGTGLLVLIGCGSCIKLGTVDPHWVQIAFAFGLTLAAAVQFTGPTSGGHLNPAVTIALLTTGQCSCLRAFLYVVSQCIGAIAGSALLWALTSATHRGTLGATLVNSNLTALQACGVEVVITFFLVFTVLAATDENRLDSLSIPVPLVVGLTVVAGHCFAISFTGSSMNTARSFGPAVVTGNWEHHWVYWVGPILGGIIAGLLYQHVFLCSPPEPEELDRVKLQFLLRFREKEIITDRTTCI